MQRSIEILIAGFPGKADVAYLGWSTVALLHLKERLVLLDTSNAGARPMLISALRERDISFSAITDVFLSHLHFDHAANCLLFPGATFHLSWKEWEYANTADDVFVNEGALISLRSFRKHFIEKDGQEIFDGVYAYLTPGHTPGSTSLIGRDDLGTWAFCGDAVKNRSELSGKGVGITLDSQTSNKSICKIKGLANHILPGHDCWLKLENDVVIPEGGNDVTIIFPEGITCCGKSQLTLSID
ncbi:MBL fold metallo-hydrolase [Synergistes jonesii]|uniref:Metallo-beta-lactamase domain-containing protein n=1 Tax=Synergistes jonesii TaxID=2754 RepID=A0A073ITU2_9BACT|nr:MBL fold metallo-hydrolase [Synergistes jonesii]KEJ92970.1 hypothetical protein EH55_13725 [Synergistes jonesii]OFB63912.1 hypothetical protein JS72_05735 [Synergistes jonesii]OFB64443.1 hypothetical protein JS73_03370 [Synergistes jonesii]OFB65716.1 hypothetical protein JS79_03955 [Synergistes jonesii]OFB68601.1 hypothetical protein JS78_03375 [Synergistes jonesii]